MSSCSECRQQLANASSPVFDPAVSSLPSTGWRLVEGFLHVVAVMGLAMLAAGGAVVGLIWFSMRLPNG
jgi:hypothetical protein